MSEKRKSQSKKKSRLSIWTWNSRLQSDQTCTHLMLTLWGAKRWSKERYFPFLIVFFLLLFASCFCCVEQSSSRKTMKLQRKVKKHFVYCLMRVSRLCAHSLQYFSASFFVLFHLMVVAVCYSLLAFVRQCQNDISISTIELLFANISIRKLNIAQCRQVFG